MLDNVKRRKLKHVINSVDLALQVLQMACSQWMLQTDPTWTFCAAYIETFVQHIITKQQHKYLIVITVSVKALVWIFKGPQCCILFAKLGLWEKLYLLTQSSSFPVPVMWLMRDKTTEERGKTNGNILFTVHEKRKWEKHDYDKKEKKKKQEICLQWKNIVLLFTQPLMCAVLSPWGEELSSSHMYLWCSRLLPSVCLSKKLYIFNWLRLPHGSKASSLVCVWFIFSQQVSSIGWVVPFQNSLTVTKTASTNQEESTGTAEMNAHADASK